MKINCNYCNKEFLPKFFVSTRPNPKFCTIKCMAHSFEKKIKLNCLLCDKEFEIVNWQSKKYCSIQCVGKKRTLVSFWKTANDQEKLEKLKELYEENVIKNNSGCWGWIKKPLNTGYGAVGPSNNTMSAHRLSFIIHNGNIPEGLFVLHKCHNPICSNPEHLYIGNTKDNSKDMINAGRGNFNKQNSKNSKLNKEKVIQIKQLLINGNSQYSIAKQFDVSRGTIQDIHRNKTWKDV